MTREAIFKQAMSLPAEDLARLIDDLRTASDPANPVITPAQRDDLRKRIEEYRAGNADLKSWEEFREELLNEK